LGVPAKFDGIPGQRDDQSDIEKKGVDQIHSRVSILSNSGSSGVLGTLTELAFEIWS
jgi:hypothetical protein